MQVSRFVITGLWLAMFAVLGVVSAYGQSVIHEKQRKEPSLEELARRQENRAQGNGTWVDRFGGEQGLNGGVNAIAIGDSGEVYVAGTFTEAGGQAVNHIAKWTGTTWEALGSGVNDRVNALAITPAGELYVGGDFTEASGQEARFIARWNGEQWEGLGQSLNGSVFAIAANDTALYVGGRFGEAGQERVRRLARWDGVAWHAVGGGVQGPFGIEDESRVYALALNAGGLYVGGHFLEAGGQPAGNIAHWDGSTWEALESGAGTMDESVWSIAISNSDAVYVGGAFMEAGGQVVNHLARLTGMAWEPLGTGVNGPIFAIALGKEGEAYVGGEFTEASGQPVNNIARWTGSAWEALGSGVNAFGVWAIAMHERDVYVGGSFTQAGGMASNFLALWQNPILTGVEVLFPDEKSNNLRFESIYPNPIYNEATLVFRLRQPSHVRLDVYNILGQRVDVLLDAVRSAGVHQNVWPVKDLPSGPYLLRLQAGSSIQVRSVTLMR